MAIDALDFSAHPIDSIYFVANKPSKVSAKKRIKYIESINITQKSKTTLFKGLETG